MNPTTISSKSYFRRNFLIATVALLVTFIIDLILSRGLLGILQIQYNRSRIFFIVENFFFLLGLISIIRVYYSISKENKFLEKIKGHLSEDFNRIRFKDVENIIGIIKNFPRYDEKSISCKRTIQNLNFFAETENPAATLEYNVKFSEMAKEEVESEFEYPRYCVWVIPIIGFVGTIYGITLAVQHFSSMLTKVAAGEEAKILIESLGQICWDLSIAFETTLPALITSGLLAFFIAILDRFADRFIWYLDTVQIDNIINKLVQSVRPSQGDFGRAAAEIEKLSAFLPLTPDQKSNLLKQVAIIKSATTEVNWGSDLKDTLKLSAESWDKLRIVVENAITKVSEKELGLDMTLNESNGFLKAQLENSQKVHISVLNLIENISAGVSLGSELKDVLTVSVKNWDDLRNFLQNTITQIKDRELELRTTLNETTKFFAGLTENTQNTYTSTVEIKSINLRQANDLELIVKSLKEQLDKIRMISEVAQDASREGIPLRLEITPSIGGNVLPMNVNQKE